MEYDENKQIKQKYILWVFFNRQQLSSHPKNQKNTCFECLLHKYTSTQNDAEWSSGQKIEMFFLRVTAAYRFVFVLIHSIAISNSNKWKILFFFILIVSIFFIRNLSEWSTSLFYRFSESGWIDESKAMTRERKKNNHWKLKKNNSYEK